MFRTVVMGVAGCGKSTVGAGVAQKLPAVYHDGDDLHPRSNIEKMSAGTPLTDADRAPWLAKVGERLGKAEPPVLIGCSALKRSYREIIRHSAGEDVFFLHLSGSREVIETRMAARDGHFMPVSLLDSQFATLEPLQIDERGAVIDIDQSLEQVIDACVAALQASAR